MGTLSTSIVLSVLILFSADEGPAQSIPCPGTPTVTYLGKIYNTVQIGNQCWLKENLDVGTRIDGVQGQTNNGITVKYCKLINPKILLLTKLNNNR